MSNRNIMWQEKPSKQYDGSDSPGVIPIPPEEADIDTLAEVMVKPETAKKGKAK